MEFVCSFEMDNEVFEHGDGEMRRVLRKLALEARKSVSAGAIIDLNGNLVGAWEIRNTHADFLKGMED